MAKKLSLQELVTVQNAGGVLRARFDYSVLDESVPVELVEKIKAYHLAKEALDEALHSLGASRIS